MKVSEEEVSCGVQFGVGSSSCCFACGLCLCNMTMPIAFLEREGVL